MEIIVGAVIVKDNKMLMVREAKEKCYGKWAFPAGHIEKEETIFDGAKRETFEETGCKIELRKAFPIFTKNTKDFSIIMMHFLADLLETNMEYDTNEILENKWLTLDEIKNMKEEEFRNYPVIKQIIESLETDNLYELNIIKNMPNI